MALSDWDKKHLGGQQQRAILSYTEQYDRAMAAGDKEAARKAHESADAIRRQAGYSGGAAGASFLPATSQNARTATARGNGYDNGSLSTAQVKQLQGVLGVAQDGYYGPKTQQAAYARWGAADADAAMKSFTSTTTPARTSFDYNEDEGVYTWNGQRYTSQSALVSAINAAKLSATEKEVLGRKAAAYNIKLTGGEFSGMPNPSRGKAQASSPKQTVQTPVLNAAQQKYQGLSLRDKAATVTDKRAESTPTAVAGPRLGLTVSGAAKLYGAQMLGAAEWVGNAADAMTPATPERSWTPAEPVMPKTSARPANTQPGKLQQLGSRLKASGSADIERAQEGLGTVGRMLVNTGVAGAQMAADVGLGLATGGGAMLPMLMRSFGGGVQQAREKGYSAAQQTALGLTTAATEYFTEKLFGGNPAYDSGAGLVNQLAAKVAGNGKLVAALSSLPADIISEGLEEVIADILEPISEKVVTGNWTGYDIDQIIEDGIVGMAMGGLGQGGQAIVNASRGGGNAATPATTRNSAAGLRNAGGTGYLTPAGVVRVATRRTRESGAPGSVTPADIVALSNGQSTARQVNEIAKDRAALARLGIDPNGKTAAQLRAEVKAGLEAKVQVTPHGNTTRANDGLGTMGRLIADSAQTQKPAAVKNTADNRYYEHSPAVYEQAPASSNTQLHSLMQTPSLNLDPVVAAMVKMSQEQGARNATPADFFSREPVIPAAETNADIGTRVAEKTLQGNMNDSLGSARGGFDPFTEAQNRYGTQDGGENAVRPDDVPISTDGVDRVSRSVVSAKGAEVTPDSFVPLLENETMRGGFSYIPITNDATTQAARDYIMQHGWEESLRNWTADARRGRYSPEMNVVGQLLFNNAVNSGHSQQALDIFADYQATLRNSAQILQSARILKRMAPEHRLYMIQKSIAQFAEETGIPSGISLSDEAQRRYTNARTEAERDAAIDAMQREVARQLPSTLRDKWNALRYVNMLGNFKTQIRNISGNVTMQALSRVKDTIAVGLENLAYAASGGQFERTKALFPGRERIAAARADFANIERIALGEGKYSGNEGSTESDFMRGAQDKKTVFKFGDNSVTRALGIEGKKGIVVYRTLEAYRKATNWAMEKGDVIFSKSTYAHALAGYLKAHNITAEQFSSSEWRASNADFVDTARAYAINEAQEVTFRDTNAVSRWVSQLARGENTPAPIRVLGEGLYPFRKTPANVGVRMEEYGPLGIINTAVKAAQAANPSSDVTSADVINQLSKALTGTGLFALGMWLRSAGLLRGGDDEDESQQSFDKLTGHQNYALELPNGLSYTLDWATPGSTSLFMGVAFQDAMSDGGLHFGDVEGVLTQLNEPMLQMSMLQSVDDTLDSLKYSKNNLFQFAGTLAVSYLTQGLTNSLLGQLERTSEPVRMTTFVDRDSPIPPWLQRMIGKASAKIPGWDYNQIPYIDAWGRTQSTGDITDRALVNILSPGYVSYSETDKIEDELQRLVDKGGKSTLYPDIAERSFQVGGSTKYLTKDEYVRYAEKKGQESARILKAMMSNRDYDALPDDKKAAAIEKAYEHASATAKGAVSSYKPGDSSWIKNARASGMPIDKYILAYEKLGGSKYLVGDAAERARAAQDIGMSLDSYITMRDNIDLNDNGSVSQAEAQEYLDTKTDLSQEQKAAMWNIINKGWKTNPYG